MNTKLAKRLRRVVRDMKMGDGFYKTMKGKYSIEPEKVLLGIEQYERMKKWN